MGDGGPGTARGPAPDSRPRGPRGADGAGKGGGGRESPAPPRGAGPGALSDPAAATRAYLCQKGRARDAGRRESLMAAALRCRRRPTAGGRGSATGSGEWAGGREREGRSEAPVVVKGDGEGGAGRPEAARVRKSSRRGGGGRDNGC